MRRSFKALPDFPVADLRPLTTQVHGVDLHDDYGWLRAPINMMKKVISIHRKIDIH
jgi:protease II